MSSDARFPTTHWSVVQRAGHPSSESGHDALTQLLQRYLPALQAYLTRVKRLPTSEAEDLLQQFVLEKVVRDQLITHADEFRGRFRTFLLTVLDRFVISQHRRASARKRQPDGGVQSLSHAAEPGAAGAGGDPSATFEVAWARQVLSETLKRMEAQCHDSGRDHLWSLFQARVLGPVFEQTEPEPYEVLIDRYGFTSPTQAANYLITAKRMFARHLREVVGEYARDEQEIEEELSDLRQILSRTGACSDHSWRTSV